MAISPYLRDLRTKVGQHLLMLPSVSGVVCDDQILLVRRADNGSWSLPAGAVEPGEQPADALIREVEEETGVRVVVQSIAGMALYPRAYPNGGSGSVPLGQHVRLAECDDSPRTFRRTNDQPVRSIKARRPRKISRDLAPS